VSNLYKNLSLSVFFALLIAASARVSIPIEPVPLTMQTAAIFVSALLLPLSYAVFSVVLYFMLGVIGLPVFAGGRSGFEVFQGPTAGFLVGFLVIAALISYLTRNDQYKTDGKTYLSLSIKVIFPCSVATGLLQTLGMLWGKVYMGSPWPIMFEQWLFPFFPNMVYKILIATLIVVPIWKYFDVIKEGQVPHENR